MAYEELKTHGITSETPQNIWLGAGTVHKGLEYDTVSSTWNFDESLIAATQGGNTLTIEPEIMNMEVDGAWTKTKGLAVKTGEVATLEMNLVEVTPDILKMVLIGQDGESDYEGYSVLESSPTIDAGHYVDNFGFVGKTLNGNPIIVIFKSALCTTGLNLEGQSKENSTLPATFECYNEVTDDLRRLNYKIYYPESVEGGAGV